MAQYSWDEWTQKYISSTWDIMGWWKAYKTSEWKWSLEDPSKSNTQTITYNGKVDNSTNVISQQSQNNNATNAKVWSWAVAWMPEQPKVETTKTSPITAESLWKSWDALTYAEQQKRLNANPWLKEKLATKGIVSKTEPEKTTTTTTTPTTKTTTTPKQTAQQDKWDYQDNSQARMDQIADNLDKYRQSMPALFDDMSAFYNFFIKDKWRSQDQIDFLWDYFNRVQKYWKYDNWSSSQLWDWLANGKIPADYLNYLKSTDPNKYAEVMAYKQEEEDTITYESYLSDISDQAGLWWFEAFYKWIFWYKDENQDGIDDGSYIAPTEEETTKQNRINTIDSRAMEIKNMQKNMLDDLVEQYPWVPKATLMWIVQDRTKDLQREYDDLMVERAGLVGSVEYLQNERDMQSKARQSTINNLEKAYWMYYDYTAEWIAEMAQNKYAATNITLDQAENWTDAQKQMALEGVLTPLYEKYGSIIQRSPAQVINDVMALAKKEWISLADAFEKNFMSQLRKKPQFATLSSWWSIWGTDKWTDITVKDAKWNDITLKMNQSTWDILNLDWTPYTWKIQTTAAGWATFTPVSKTELSSALSKTKSQYWVGSKYKDGRCWQIVNLYLQNAWSNIQLWDDISTKTKWITNDDPNSTPNEWDIVVWDMSKNPKASDVAKESWHVAIVTKVYDDWSFDVYQQNWHWNHTVSEDHISSRNYIAWFIDPTAVQWWDYSSYDYSDYETWILNLIPIQLKNTEWEKKIIMDKIKSYYDRWMSQLDWALIQMWFNVQKATPEWKWVAQDILRMLSYVADPEAFDETFMFMLANDVNGWNYADAIDKAENQVYKFIAKSWNNAISRTDMWDAAIALSALNKYKNNWNWFENVELSIEDIIWAEWKNVGKFDIWQANLLNALEWLWYSEDNALQMVPDLKNTRSTFVWKMETLQNLLLEKYNKQRAQYWMQPVTLAVLLGNQSILTAYWLNAEWEALQKF